MAKKALEYNPNYLAFGSFYKSKLKPRAIKASLEIIKWAKNNTKKPIVVIGGITNKNYRKLIKWEQNTLLYQVLFGITQN